MPTSKIEKFGRNLGFGIKPWVQRFGVDWQMHLAQALLEPSKQEYRGLKIPISPIMRQEAHAFIQHNTALHQGNQSPWKKIYKDGQLQIKNITHTHHSLIQKAYNDTLRYQAVYGKQKYIDPKNQQTILQYKEAIKYARTHKEKRELKSKLREFQQKVTQNRWEVEARKHAIIPKSDPALSRKNALEGAKFIKQHNIEKLKMQRAQLAATGENFWEKQFAGDPGEEIGKGMEINEEDTDPKSWVRLAQYLKKARFIKLSVYKGIMEPKRRALRAFLQRVNGTKWYREFFLSHNAPQKYATAAYFVPGSEYGTMKASYDNKKGQYSPLQRMRHFTKSGKEILKMEK